MGLGKKTIDDQNYCGKKVLVRCDFNVPMKDGVITNENRINAALPTIQKLVNDGAKVILCSHLGKPKNGPEAKFSLAPVAVALSAKLGKTVVFADDDNVVGENAKAAVAAMNNGDVVLLQNTRFRKEETKNMPEFSQELASLADAYVDDAFGSCHRAHCSTAGVTDYIMSYQPVLPARNTHEYRLRSRDPCVLHHPVQTSEAFWISELLHKPES